MTMNVSLPDDLAAFVEARIASGRYGSSIEVVSEALNLLKEFDRSDTARLRRAWGEGIASGDAGTLDVQALKTEARRRAASRGE